jgi:hypothetical protein
MSNRKEQSAAIIDRYMAQVNSEPVGLEEVADWALREGLFSPGPQDVRRLCRDALAEGARAQKRFDGKRWYRAKHAVRQNIGGVQMSLWADIDKNASRTFMEKSIGQRRRSIVDDCFQLKMDADHFNEANSEFVPIQTIFDFSQDIAEREAFDRESHIDGSSTKARTNA